MQKTCKIMMKEVKRQTCTPPKAIYRVSALLIKLRRAFFTELELKSLQFVWKHKRPQIAKAILKRKMRAEGIRLPDLIMYYKAIVIKTVWYWHKSNYRCKLYLNLSPPKYSNIRKCPCYVFGWPSGI